MGNRAESGREGGYTIGIAVGLTIWEGETRHFRAGSAFVRRRLDIMRRPT